jgi:hypothetical protein
MLGVVGAIVVAVAVAVASDPGPVPRLAVDRSASPALRASPAPQTTTPSTPPSATPSTPATIPPQVDAATVVILRDVADPASTLAALTGCADSVRSSRGPFDPAIKGADVDAVAAAAGVDAGAWLFVPPGIRAATRVWLGDDVAQLASAVGEPVVAISPKGEVWLGGPAGATRWVPVATPHGRTAWAMGVEEVAGAGVCSPWTLPFRILGQRSVTCAGLGEPACLDLLAAVVADTPGVLLPGGAAVVAAPPCPSSRDCGALPRTVLGLPAGWSGSPSEVRAAAVGHDGAAPTRLAGGLLPVNAIDAISRPSLPLPTGGEKVKFNTCSETLTGQLHASPWDPRVAWVGDMPVVWPTGTVLRFLPLAQLTTAGDPYGASAAEGDEVTVTGMLSDSGLAFNGCAMRLMPSSAATGSGSSLALRP